MMHLDQAQVLSNQAVGPDLYEMEIKSPLIAAQCQPGQFIHIRPGQEYDPLLRRPLSLYDVDAAAGTIYFLYKVVGRGTELLTRVQAGSRVDVMGPMGRGFTLPGTGSRCLLVGGGVGMAPLVFLARRLVQIGCEAVVLYGAATQSGLGAYSRIASLQVDCAAATDDGSAYYNGNVIDMLTGPGGLWLDPARTDFIYTCGPEPMMAAVAGFAREAGIPGEVSLEEYMACGVGACLGCARKLKPDAAEYVKVCKDGPVFGMDEVAL